MGIFWFRVHNWWAQQLQTTYSRYNITKSEEFLYNRARIFTIATYQVIFADCQGVPTL